MCWGANMNDYKTVKLHFDFEKGFLNHIGHSEKWSSGLETGVSYNVMGGDRTIKANYSAIKHMEAFDNGIKKGEVIPNGPIKQEMIRTPDAFLEILKIVRSQNWNQININERQFDSSEKVYGRVKTLVNGVSTEAEINDGVKELFALIAKSGYTIGIKPKDIGLSRTFLNIPTSYIKTDLPPQNISGDRGIFGSK